LIQNKGSKWYSTIDGVGYMVSALVAWLSSYSLVISLSLNKFFNQVSFYLVCWSIRDFWCFFFLHVIVGRGWGVHSEEKRKEGSR
jgi:hypothetical protein